MKRSFELTAPAAQDLDQILDYILEDSGPRAALRVHQRLFEAFSQVAEHPGIGHHRDDIVDPSLRVWVVFSYLIVYDPASRPVHIIRVIHGARDLRSAFDEA